MTTTTPDQAESAQILDQLQKLAAGGAIDYVLPTTPLGEEWIVGHQGQILKMVGNGEAAAFLTGTTVGMTVVARLAGIELPGMPRS